MGKAPAYQMYAGDWLKSRSVRLMEDYQRGWYIQLLNEAWDGDPQCFLPDDDELLQKLAGVSESTRAQPSFNDRWAFVKRLFKQRDGYVYNERQFEEFCKQENRRESAIKAGVKSALARKQRTDEVKEMKSRILTQSNDRSTIVEQSLNDRSTLLSSTSTSTSSSTITPLKPPRKRVGGDGEKCSDDIFEQAWAAFGRYGVKKKALAYWKRYSTDDRNAIAEQVPKYMAVVKAGRRQMQMEGWLNPEHRRWDMEWSVALQVQQQAEQKPERPEMDPDTLSACLEIRDLYRRQLGDGKISDDQDGDMRAVAALLRTRDKRSIESGIRGYGNQMDRQWHKAMTLRQWVNKQMEGER